jgi:signal transduction histidine kinase
MKYFGAAFAGALKALGIGFVASIIIMFIAEIGGNSHGGLANFGALLFFASPIIGAALAVSSAKQKEEEARQRGIEQARIEAKRQEEERERKEKERIENESRRQRQIDREAEERCQRASHLDSLKRSLSTLSLERLRFERQVLKEKVDEAKSELETVRKNNSDFYNEYGFQAHFVENCNRIEAEAQAVVNKALEELGICEEILRSKL